MTKDFRPSELHLNYLNDDMLPFLEEIGLDTKNFIWEIRSIVWYNWDNQPKWFVNISKVDPTSFKKVGYIEVDMEVGGYGGYNSPLTIFLLKLAEHGYPCNSIEIAVCVDGEYIIEGIE